MAARCTAGCCCTSIVRIVETIAMLPTCLALGACTVQDHKLILRYKATERAMVGWQLDKRVTHSNKIEVRIVNRYKHSQRRIALPLCPVGMSSSAL